MEIRLVIKKLNYARKNNMISSELVFVQLAQINDYICIVELAMMLESSVSQVRHRLKELGDRVECNDQDEWRITKSISANNLLLERVALDGNRQDRARPLSKAEKAERDRLEQTVKQAFYLAGKSLKTLRDKKLYRETHGTFEEYCRDCFDFTRRAADYLILSAEVVENLKREQFVLKTDVLPTKESQCRPLAKLSPKEQRKVWRTAVEQAKGKVPSAKIIKEIIKQNSSNLDIEIKPKDKEIIYKPGTGIDYIVHLDEETYRMLEIYQDRIGTATKNGAIKRLLDNAIAK
jgi:hypothetical protein